MDLSAIILAAGKGSRLVEATFGSPKPLVDINGISPSVALGITTDSQEPCDCCAPDLEVGQNGSTKTDNGHVERHTNCFTYNQNQKKTRMKKSAEARFVVAVSSSSSSSSSAE